MFENKSTTTHEVGSLNLQTTISGELDIHPGPMKNSISDPKEKSNIFQKSTFLQHFGSTNGKLVVWDSRGT